MFRKLGIGLALSFFALAGPANATLIGDTVTAEVLFAGAPSGQGPTSAVVGAGVEFDFTNVDIDVGASGADYLMILGGTVIEDETYLLTDLDWVDAAGFIIGVTIESFAGLSIDPVALFGFHAVSLTLASGTLVDRDAYVSVSFQTDHATTSVPEPISLALFGVGLTGLGFFLRRRKLKAA